MKGKEKKPSLLLAGLC